MLRERKERKRERGGVKAFRLTDTSKQKPSKLKGSRKKLFSKHGAQEKAFLNILDAQDMLIAD